MTPKGVVGQAKHPFGDEGLELRDAFARGALVALEQGAANCLDVPEVAAHDVVSLQMSDEETEIAARIAKGSVVQIDHSDLVSHENDLLVVEIAVDCREIEPRGRQQDSVCART